jgi:hypothetical protein
MKEDCVTLHRGDWRHVLLEMLVPRDDRWPSIPSRHRESPKQSVDYATIRAEDKVIGG